MANTARAYVSDYIVDEGTTLTYARTRNRNQSERFLDMCLKSDQLITLLNVGTDGFNQTVAEYPKHQSLSFTDCSHLVLMRQHGIRHIATFDGGFKQVAQIEVIDG